jgi:hypothetical protein
MQKSTKNKTYILIAGRMHMANITETKITSGEIGILWMSYQVKSLLCNMNGLFAQKTTDQKAKDILNNYVMEAEKHIAEMKKIFENEKAVVPIAFDSRDVFDDAPALFDDMFHIMFLRTMAKINLGFNSIHLGMSYRKDIREFFINALKLSQDTYNICTDYLTEQGVLARPPYVSMPKEVEFIEAEKYMSGIQLMGNKRALNTLEISYIYFMIEANVMGMQLMTGFAQVAKEKEVKDYFVKGKELSKKIVSDLSGIILQSDIQPPTSWAGKATDSIVPPFSDKMMMFLSNILSSYAMGSNALGMSFSMRSDLPVKLAVLAKNTLDYARAGGKLMIKHKWLEEPPQMEDRNQLISSKQ